jgi:hypothetical protein
VPLVAGGKEGVSLGFASLFEARPSALIHVLSCLIHATVLGGCSANGAWRRAVCPAVH